MRLKEFLENKIHNKEIVWDNKSQLIKASGEKVNGNNIAKDWALPNPGNAPKTIPKNTPDTIIIIVVNVKTLKIKFGKFIKSSI